MVLCRFISLISESDDAAAILVGGFMFLGCVLVMVLSIVCPAERETGLPPGFDDDPDYWKKVPRSSTMDIKSTKSTARGSQVKILDSDV